MPNTLWNLWHMVPHIMPDSVQEIPTGLVWKQSMGGIADQEEPSKNVLFGPQSICQRAVITYLGGFTLVG